MKIVKIAGGLGNQMFQYAMYKSLYNKFTDAYFETFSAGPFHNGFELNNVFNIDQNAISDRGWLDNLTTYQQNNWSGYYPEIYKKDNVHFLGTWGNANYITNEYDLKKEFTFKQELDATNKEILKQIQESNSISIHVRRGDYAKLAYIFFQADWMNYYSLAVNYISKNTHNKPLTFFIFSDDIDWCKKNIYVPAIYVENKGKDSWKDILLMSHCKHNIIANSTFSWWGAWLNNNPDKVVTTPKIWLLDNKINELIASDKLIKI